MPPPGLMSSSGRSATEVIVPSAPQEAADVASHYDELDAVYREIWGEHVHHGYWRTGRESVAEATEALTGLVAERLAPAAGQALVDIGCGYGASAELLAARHDVTVSGFTLSEAQAAVARERVPAKGALAIHVRDWLDNGLPGAAFNGAYAIESTEHMADKQRFFDEAYRVLKPGGRLVACVWLAGEAPSAFAVRHLLKPICREGRLPGMGSRSDYETMATRAGFVPLRYDDISREVRRTWSIVTRRVARRFIRDRDFRRFALNRTTRNRDFMLSLPRLIVALRSGAMRYGVFAWQKPA